MPYIEDHQEPGEEGGLPSRHHKKLGVAAAFLIAVVGIASFMGRGDDEPHRYSEESVQHFVNRDAYPMLWTLESVHQITGETWIARDWEEADVGLLADQICQYAYVAEDYEKFQFETYRFWGDSSYLFTEPTKWQDKAVMASWIFIEQRCPYVIEDITPVLPS